MNSVHKSPKIYVNLQIADTLFLIIKLPCLAKNFKAIAWKNFELELVKV